MKFDIDCAREILLTLEAKENDCSMNFTELNNSLPSFSGKPMTVMYHCFKLEEAGFITLELKGNKSGYIERITGITAEGHVYLSELSCDNQAPHPDSYINTPADKYTESRLKTALEIIVAVTGVVMAIAAVVEMFK